MGWILPVGTPGGFCLAPQTARRSGLIRVGDRIKLIDPAYYLVWRAAAAAPDVEELASWATGEGIEEVDEIITDLLNDALLLTPDEQPEVRVGELALAFIGEGLSSDGEGGSTFTVIGSAGIRLDVNAIVYDFLIRTDGTQASGSLCSALDAHRPTDAPATLHQLVKGLPLLVRSGVVRLNAAMTA
jgi:hypothetical protein